MNIKLVLSEQDFDLLKMCVSNYAGIILVKAGYKAKNPYMDILSTLNSVKIKKVCQRKAKS